MSLSQEIAPLLPCLRRYARALTGSQTSGDAYVVGTLQAIIASPDNFPNRMGPKAGLYRVFSALYAPAINAGLAEPAIDSTVLSVLEPSLKNLAGLTARSRQSFLLTSVEGFPKDEVAFILNIDTKIVTQLIADAGRELAACVATDVLIIEDEAVIAADLAMIVQELGHSIAGIARTQTEAEDLTRRRRAGLILSDIHLADGSSGVDAVNNVLRGEALPIIFITGYPERLLTGSRPEPTFLVTKPYRPEALKATICQTLFFNQRASAPQPLRPAN